MNLIAVPPFVAAILTFGGAVKLVHAPESIHELTRETASASIKDVASGGICVAPRVAMRVCNMELATPVGTTTRAAALPKLLTSGPLMIFASAVKLVMFVFQ